MGKKKKEPSSKRVKHVPMVMQMEALECGAASLTMILAYYGKWIPLEKVRSDCGVSRDGSNALSVLKAARNYNLEANGYKYEVDEIQSEGSFPCIIHWNFNHFVVLDGFENGKAYLNDPAMGTYSVSNEEFDDSFTGVCLEFAPTEDFVPEGKQTSMLSMSFSRLLRTPLLFVFVAIMIALSSLFDLIPPACKRFFTDYLIFPGSDSTPFL